MLSEDPNQTFPISSGHNGDSQRVFIRTFSKPSWSFKFLGTTQTVTLGIGQIRLFLVKKKNDSLHHRNKRTNNKNKKKSSQSLKKVDSNRNRFHMKISRIKA